MATKLTGFPILSGQDIATNSSTQTMPIGTYMETADGRGYRYAKNGAVATIAGKVYQSSALDATNLQPAGSFLIVSAAVAAGATTVTCTNTGGSMTLAVNQLAGGYLSVTSVDGAGYLYRINGNAVAAAAATATIYLEDPIVVALTTSSTVHLLKHPYDGTVVEPGTPTGMIVGVPNAIFTAAYYYWIQTFGTCSVLFTGTGVAGKAVGSLTGGTSGSMAPAIAATNIGGHNIYTSITGTYSAIYLTIH